jgi:phosphatidylserine/phosphatidylglycerophosphate/cardiolipin synthase-like enzyme/regulation of enolase protein 1 (concanavalin A-like superfamily)
VIGALSIACTVIAVPRASADDHMYFPAVDNVTQVLVNLINAERGPGARVDIASWYLSEHAIVDAISKAWAAGVPVRVIGDRGALFEGDPGTFPCTTSPSHTRCEFYWLANKGIPIRLRVNPTSYPEIMHWKTAILAGQGKVLFGSGNFAPTELAPDTSDPTNYDDESEMVTDDPVIVGAFKTKFDQMWNDQTQEPSVYATPNRPPYLQNWDDACAVEHTGKCTDYKTVYPNPVPMVINTARLEPDNPMPPEMVWGQGTYSKVINGAVQEGLNNRMVREINNESNHIELVIYRLTVANITNALLAKRQAGVPIRVIVDYPCCNGNGGQYANNLFPEYELTHAYVDQLYAAGVSIRRKNHKGVTHMKTLITSAYASNASSNYSATWQRDQDYFISSSAKPAAYQAMLDRFNIMWNDNVGFAAFTPLPPNAAVLAGPTSGSTGVTTTPTLVWNRASFATSFDVYLGTSSSNMSLVANVPAQLVNSPPTQYSWTPTTPLAGGTTYFWKIVSKTFANLTANSSTWSFTTAGTGSLPGTPGSPTPASGATGVATNATLSWSASSATSYDVRLGTTSTPPTVSAGQTASSFTPSGLVGNTTYFWQIVARNSVGTTTGPVWSFTTAAASSGPVPPPWANSDVGSPGAAGSASYNTTTGTFTVSGAGADIWGTADAFQYVYQPLSGDGSIVARLTNIQNTNQYAKAGVMIRASTAANAAHVMIDGNPNNNVEFETRPSTGAQTTWVAGDVQARPAWLRLTRSGSTITGSVSADGSTWRDVGSATFSTGNALVGLIVLSHNTSTLNTSTFDNVSVTGASPTPPSTPASPNPANGASGTSTSPTLTWTASGATSYDVSFGTSNPPPQVSSAQPAASYTPSNLTASTTYFWQIVARNSAGTTSGPVWSFTTAAAAQPPGTPGSPNPADGAAGVATNATLTWSASGATSYDVNFGTSNPPPQAASGLSSASYTPANLVSGTTYFWQIVARNNAGPTTGPVWSFTTAAAPPPVQNIVIYASDVPANGLHGSWSVANDSSSPNGVKLVTPDNGVANTSNALAAPTDYVDVVFNAPAGTSYRLWLRMQALGNSKFNDSLWVQFSDAKSGSANVYQMNTTQGLLVNLATTSDATSLNQWGWQNGAYWLSQPTTVTFANSGTHTIRIQVREDGVQFDQIVLSPNQYLGSAPGPVGGDNTIVPKP